MHFIQVLPNVMSHVALPMYVRALQELTRGCSFMRMCSYMWMLTYVQCIVIIECNRSMQRKDGV